MKFARHTTSLAISREISRHEKAGKRDPWTEERMFELRHEQGLRKAGIIALDGELEPFRNQESPNA